MTHPGVGLREIEPQLNRLPDFQQALARLGLKPSDVPRESRVIKAGETLQLSGVASSPLLCRQLLTQDLDQFKQWIGVPDKEIEQGLLGPPKALPSAWSARLEGPKEELTAEEWNEVLRAAEYYLFGHSAKVAHYRKAIETHLAPFEAALFVADKLVVEPGAALVVQGYPAILIVNDLEIQQGGHLKFYSPLRMMVTTLRKAGSQLNPNTFGRLL